MRSLARDVIYIRNELGIISPCYNLFRYSKRQNLLKNYIDKMENPTEKQKLKSDYTTKWVKRHKAVDTFLELQEAVISVLEEIKTFTN